MRRGRAHWLGAWLLAAECFSAVPDRRAETPCVEAKTFSAKNFRPGIVKPVVGAGASSASAKSRSSIAKPMASGLTGSFSSTMPSLLLSVR